MGQFVGCLKASRKPAARSTSGRVRQRLALQRDPISWRRIGPAASCPTPSIGGVGLLDDFTKSATLSFKAEGEAILLIGETHGWLGQSVYLRDILRREEGAPFRRDFPESRTADSPNSGRLHDECGIGARADCFRTGGLLNLRPGGDGDGEAG